MIASTPVWRLLIFGALSGFWFLLTFNASIDEFSYHDKLLVSILLTVGLAGQVTVWACVVIFTPRGDGARRWENTVLTLFTVVNLFSLHVCFIVPFAALDGEVQLLFLFLAVFVAFQCFQFCAASSRFAIVVFVTAAVSFLYQIGIYALGGAPPPPSVTQAIASDNVKIVRFQKTPNVYFISFDAMVPDAIARKYLGMETLPYQEFLTDFGFFRFRNAFSDGPGTRQALNRLLAFDPDYYQQLGEVGRQYRLFNGQEPSPLLQIFKANGYTTSTYMRNRYLGALPGPHVDRYKPQRFFTLCVNKPTEIAASFGFFGYCVLLEHTSWWRSWLGVERIKLDLRSLILIERYIEFLLDDFTARLAIGGRHFFMAHILSPNDSPTDYDHLDPQQVAVERERYKYNATHQTPAIMKRILDFITTNDPQALVYIYSDHGDKISRFLHDTAADEWSESLTKFFIQDKYGILSVFYPPDACPQEISFLSAQNYVTNSMVARQIVRCLAGGEDPFVKEIEYRLLPEFGNRYSYGYRREMHSYHLEDYLYE